MSTLHRGATTPLCLLFVATTAAASSTGCSGGPDPSPTARESSPLIGSPIGGMVLTQSNGADANELVVYTRASDGMLTAAGQVATGGTGLGAGLNAQGAIARDGRFLLVVNAGSNDVSTFDLASGSPVLVARTPSGGTQPVSVAASGRDVYVLNAVGPGNVAGFVLDGLGQLHATGTLPLSGADVTPTDVAFAPDGRTLVVTEKGTSLIDTYSVDAAGTAHGPDVQPSDGPAPFGFAFAPDGELFVSEAANSAASAYAVLGERLFSISASVENGQSATCWLTTSPDGLHVFTANAGNGTLSSYSVGAWGRLSLEEGVAGETGATSHPVDMAFSATGAYLYALANAGGTITAFRAAGGQLTPVGSVAGLASSATGLVAW